MMNMKRTIAFSVFCLALWGCAWAEKPVIYHETGVASWYGWKYAGKKTASGVKFWPWRRLAAHPFLPFGTKVKVTNLDNGRSAWVWIADRGPVPEDRSIDLSRRSARKLRFKRKGLASVQLEVYRWPPGAE